MTFRKFEQDYHGTMSLDCSKEFHDIRMNCDHLYQIAHRDKVETYNETPWHLKTKNKPILAPVLICIALAAGVAAMAVISDEQNHSQQTK